MAIGNVLVRMRPGNDAALCFLLQKGFWAEAFAGMSVREFLHETLGYDDPFIESDVRTIFLNSSPVDDIDGARLADGDVIALGSAMPGLVGICMGRETLVSGFRSGISPKERALSGDHASITVRTKIFSTLAAATGRAILDRGILIDAAQLHEFLSQRAQAVESIDDGPSGQGLDRLAELGGRVFLRVLMPC